MTDIIQEELSIITSKRVRKEMFYFLTQSNRSGLCEGFYKPTLINIKKIQLIFLLKLKNISTITIKITPDYPFKCPEVFVNNHKYKSLLGCKNIPDLKNINKHKCFACSSLTCHSNWGPMCNIIQILKEIDSNYKIVRRLFERKMASYVVNCIFGHYIPVITFL
tara:strand:+ start:2292 stop:2783 length:492 start_codon:yes stop_codon:yes gene_type:complete